MSRKKRLDVLQAAGPSAAAETAIAAEVDEVPENLRPFEPLTDRQFECLKFIYLYFVERRYYPTQKEIAEGLGVKSNTAAFFTEPIQKKRYLHVEPGRHRNIRLTPLAIKLLTEKGVITEAFQLPLLS